MSDFNLSNVNFWPKRQRYACIALFLGAGLGLSWFWQVQPLRLQQSVLAVAEMQLPQGGLKSKRTDLLIAKKMEPPIKAIGADELKKAVIGMLESDALLLEKWIPSDQGWTLQVSGAYRNIFDLIQNLAQGPIAWDLQDLKLRKLGRASVRLSMVAKPLARLHEFTQPSSQYSLVQGLQQEHKQKALFSTEDVPEPNGKAVQTLTSSVLQIAMEEPVVLLGIVGLGEGKRRAIFGVRDMSHIVQKGDFFLNWHVVEIEQKRVQLKNTARQILVVDLFNSAAAHEQ